MRHVISLMHMSLDGFVAGPNGEMDWIRIDDEIFSYVDRFIDSADTAFYGPKTFGMMESHWPKVLRDPQASGHQLVHARWYERAEKLVFSRELDMLDNKHVKLVRQNLASEVAELKQRPGKNIVILGSPGLVQSFSKLVLIDEFVITINPVILGGGIPMFKGIDLRIGLHLAGSTQFKSVVIGAHYIRRELVSA